MLGLIAGVCAGCCIDKNALIALTFDDLESRFLMIMRMMRRMMAMIMLLMMMMRWSTGDDYNDYDADMVEFSPLVRSQSRPGFFLSPPTCHKTNQDKCQIFI